MVGRSGAWREAAPALPERLRNSGRAARASNYPGNGSSISQKETKETEKQAVRLVLI
jgi:hypothetical protein